MIPSQQDHWQNQRCSSEGVTVVLRADRKIRA
jgi:hypothetical protein